jgi:putative ABC transport system substrate-binding protein
MPRPRRLLGVVILIAAAVLSACGRSSETKDDAGAQHKKIAIVYIAPHELINQIIAGFKERLSEELGTANVDFIEMHASGDTTQYAATVRAAISRRPDVLAPITTPIAQIALKEAPPGLPVCFLGITDPLGAGLVRSLDRPERCTGVSDLAPFAATLDFIRRIAPNVKAIGMPYSPDEQPAVFARDQMTALGTARGIRVDARPVTNKDDLPSMLRELVRVTDALIIGSDNGMFEAAPVIAKTALDARKPVFAGDSTSIKAGAVGGYTVDYRDVGKQGAELVSRILRGERAGDIPVVVLRKGVLELNADTARRLGITFAPDVLQEARSVVGR